MINKTNELEKAKLSETDMIKLIHELKVKQIELELQQEELKKSEEYLKLALESTQEELRLANIKLEYQSEENKKHAYELIVAKEKIYNRTVQLEESEANFKSLFNSISSYLFILDEQGNIIEVNDTVKNKLKYSLEELIGKSVLIVHPENQREEAGQIVLEMLQGTKNYCPVPIITKDNILIPVETYISRGIWNGKPALFGISKDISQLKASEEKFAKAFQENPAILGLSDLETGEYIEVNQTFYNKFKMKREDVIGIASSKVLEFDPLFRQKVLEQLKLNGSIRNIETTIRSKNGIELDLLLSADIIEIQGKNYNFTTAIDITERKQHEKEMRIAKKKVEESEEKYRIVADYTYDWEYWIDVDGNFIYISPSCKRITGYDPDDFLNNNKLMYEIIHPEDLNIFKKHKHNINENGERSLIEFRIITKQKEIIWIGHVCQNVITTNGKLLGIRGSNRDITENKQSEEQIRKLFIAVEQSPATVVITNLNGDIEYVNPKFSEITGYSSEEAMLKNPRILKSDEMSLEEYKNMWKTIVSGKEWRGEFRNKRKNGEFYWELASISSIRNNKGVITHYIGVKEDITEHKLTEQALKESEIKYRTIIEHSNDAIAIRQKGKFEFVNKAFSKMLNYSIIELLGVENSLIFDSDILKDMEKRISKNDINENFSIQLETVITKKDKSKIDVEIFEKIINYKEEKAQLIIVHDITKQKAIMKILQRGAEQTKGLNELIPICAACSLIRDDEKENKPWVKPANYINERLPEIKFSHSMCPDCIKKWYSDFKSNE